MYVRIYVCMHVFMYVVMDCHLLLAALCLYTDPPKIRVCFGILVLLLLAVVVGGVWFGATPSSTPLPSSSHALTCDRPMPNSDAMQLEERQVEMKLGLKEISDKFITLTKSFTKAFITRSKYEDPVLHDKMKSISSAMEKIVEEFRDIFDDDFHDDPETTLTGLKSTGDIIVKGKRDETIQVVEDMCQATEELAERVESSKGTVDSKECETHQC